MIAREPERYGPLADGLPGGPGNPLGPRAIYLYRDGADTLYRLHGTVEPRSIGTRVSSGCVRLFNQDIIDLYRRVLSAAASWCCRRRRSSCGRSRRTAMTEVEFTVTPGYGPPLRERLHYSQAVRIGDRVEISGQGGWDDDMSFPEALEEEIAQAFRNVARTLATAGAGWPDVVHVVSYHVGGFPPAVNETMARLFREHMPDRAPVWTEIGVAALGASGMRVEIVVTAIAGSAADTAAGR